MASILQRSARSSGPATPRFDTAAVDQFSSGVWISFRAAPSRAACDAKVALACGVLARIYQGHSEDSERLAEIEPLLVRGCAGNDPLSCESLGEHKLDRMFKEQEPSEVASHYMKACELGNGRACMAAAFVMMGDIPSQREKELYGKACDAGYAQACVSAGRIDRMTPEQSRAAHAGMERECRRGVKVACTLL